MSDFTSREAELRALVSRLGLSLSGVRLLDRALTHASALGDFPVLAGNNESLEFLGDAVLGLAVAQWLYEHVPDLSPGQYTQMRARVVNRRSLANSAEAIDLGRFIRLGRGEESAGGRRRPGLLADCFEAMVGAIFLEAGWDAARDFVIRILGSDLEAAPHTANEWDYRSQLQIYCQSRQWPLPEFEVTRESGPDHKKVFEVTAKVRGEVAGSGRGSTKKEAEQDAAKAALEKDRQLWGGSSPA
jgi:ribonuclease-3